MPVFSHCLQPGSQFSRRLPPSFLGAAVVPIMSVWFFWRTTSLAIGTPVCFFIWLFTLRDFAQRWSFIALCFLWRCLLPYLLLLGRIISLLLPLLLSHVWIGKKGKFYSKSCIPGQKWLTLAVFFLHSSKTWLCSEYWPRLFFFSAFLLGVSKALTVMATLECWNK